jgi:hypothetical protein
MLLFIGRRFRTLPSFVVVFLVMTHCYVSLFGAGVIAMPPSFTIPAHIVHARLLPTPSIQPNKKKQLWMYQGALFDPLDGRQIASVQGLEVVQPVDNTTHLAIHSILHHANSTFEDSKTIWSQKIFCYTTAAAAAAAPSTQSSKPQQQQQQLPQDDQILQTVRVRPQSPQKHVPLDQAVVVYETATTFISRDHDDKELLVHSEWPNSQTIWGTAFLKRRRRSSNQQPWRQQQQQSQQLQQQTSRRRDGNGNDIQNDTVDVDSGIDFTVYAKIRSRKSPLFKPDLTSQQQQQEHSEGKGLVVSPKRSALVQFGSSSGTMESKHKFGARETYSYRNVPSLPCRNENFLSLIGRKLKRASTVSLTPTTILLYTRYGEGPPFYAPGRMCMLELEARPIQSLNDATSVLQSLVKPGGPVVGLQWNENEDGMSSRNDKSVPVSQQAPVSIQQAWGLDTGKRTQSIKGRVQPYGTTATSTPAASHQLLHLSYDPWSSLNDDGPSNKIRHLPLWIKKGRIRAINIWEKVRVSTMVDNSSSLL